ncbi:hypothetical protein EfmGK923_22480 [Enterococcus faecium]|nr:hypothetical protein EfmGK923_22480 [Enterococcus faecium]
MLILDNEFILQFIKSPTFIKEVKRNTEGSVREYLFYENFANIKFPFTRNKEEQWFTFQLNPAYFANFV